MATGNAKRFIELGMPQPQAIELAKQITAGVGKLARLAEVGFMPGEAKALVQLIGGTAISNNKLSERGLVPRWIREITTQVGSVTPFPTANLIMDYRAQNVTGVADNATLTGATDAVTGFVASTYGAPKYRTAGYNGKPTFYFDGGSQLRLGRPTALLNAMAAQECTVAVAYVVPADGSTDFYGGPFGQHAGEGAAFQANSTAGYFSAGTGNGVLTPGQLVVEVKTITRGDIIPAGHLGRGYMNNTSAGAAGALDTRVSNPGDFVIGATEDYLARSFGAFFKGHILGVSAYSGAMLPKDVARMVRYWHEYTGTTLPQASRQRFIVYLDNSIYELGADARDTTVSSFAETAMGRPVLGANMNISKASASTRDIKFIVEREITGLSAALGKQLVVVIGQWNNGFESEYQAMFTAVKTVDPNAIVAGVTSTALGDGDDGTGHATGPRANEGARATYNGQLYNSANPGGIQTGVTGVDLMIPTHLNSKIGIPGSAYGAERVTYYNDQQHLKGNRSADCGHRQLGLVTIGPALQAAGLAA